MRERLPKPAYKALKKTIDEGTPLDRDIAEIVAKTVVINGFSKAYAMTGWRLGYCLGHPDLISQMYKIHQYAIMCSPTTAPICSHRSFKKQ